MSISFILGDGSPAYAQFMKELAPYMMSRIELEAPKSANTHTLQQLNKCLSRINLNSNGADKELADRV